jgi:uncharacterized protein YigE (DUF2233 family)
MRIILSLALLAGVSLAAPAMAQNQPEAAKPAKPKRICRVDPTTGSVMPRYVCHSKEEWSAIDKIARDASENSQNGLGTMNSGTRNGSVGS